MKKDVTVYLKHIIESIVRIEEYTLDIDFEGFSDNTLIQDGVIRQLEIIGEATKNIPKSFTSKHENISWRKIAGMRDNLIHKYFGVDLEITWAVVKDDILELKKNIKKILKEIS